MKFRPIRVIECWEWEWCIEIRDDFICHFAIGVKNLQTSTNQVMLLISAAVSRDAASGGGRSFRRVRSYFDSMP